jgi:hypothetical protein
MSNNGKVFISHAHEDTERCKPLLDALDAWKVDYWFDTARMHAGDQLTSRIQQALEERDIFLRVCTSASQHSFWTTLESDAYRGIQARDRGRQPPRQRVFINVILDAAYTQQPFDYAAIFIDATDKPQDAWLDELRRALDAAVLDSDQQPMDGGESAPIVTSLGSGTFKAQGLPRRRSTVLSMWSWRFVGRASLVAVGAAAAILAVVDSPALQRWVAGAISPPNPTARLIAESSYATVSPGCDSVRDPADVKWYTYNVAARCLPNDGGTHIDQEALSDGGLLIFKPSAGHAFAKNHSVSVTALKLSERGCIGILTRSIVADSRGYGFYVCADGNWYIIKYSQGHGVPVILSQSTPSTSEQLASAYTLVATVANDQLQMTINSGLAHSARDSDFDSCQQITIVVAGEENIGDFLPATTATSGDVRNVSYQAL